MGTTGLSAIERTLYGSTTLSVIKHLTRPVICVPKGKEYGAGIKKIGFACDLQDVEASTPFEQITHFVKELNAELHILNVEQQEPKPDHCRTNSYPGYCNQRNESAVSFHRS